jgi:hypothetical protein
MRIPLSSFLRKRAVRIVVTMPPAEWFYGLARQYALAYADTLRASLIAADANAGSRRVWRSRGIVVPVRGERQ